MDFLGGVPVTFSVLLYAENRPAEHPAVFMIFGTNV